MLVCFQVGNTWSGQEKVEATLPHRCPALGGHTAAIIIPLGEGGGISQQWDGSVDRCKTLPNDQKSVTSFVHLPPLGEVAAKL